MSDKGTYGQRTESVATTLQPYPRPGSVIVIDWILNELPMADVLLLEDLRLRADHGCKKHGTFLYARNGRDPRIDFYQEVLDAIFYAAQCIIEGNDAYRPRLAALLFIANSTRMELAQQ